MFTIYRLTFDSEGNEQSRDEVEQFVEQPAPAPTLGGRLLALKNETGADHVAVATTTA